MQRYSVDRIEANSAILIDQNLNVKNQSLLTLPKNTKEGDILLYDDCKNVYILLAKETEIEKENMKLRLNSIFNRTEKD